MPTTPPSPIDMSAVFPEVIPFGRSTIRLHPRKGSPTAEQSSVGGPLLWPASEPWPSCGADGAFGRHPRGAGGVPLVPVAQLLADDIPELPFPDGADVLQVLWCPFDHRPWGSPRPQLRWRSRANIGPRLARMPAPHKDADPRHVPGPCVIAPERVVEYPTADLPRGVREEIEDAIERVQAETGWHYEVDLAVASGTKVGGYPSWIQLPDWPVCRCGVRMAHLLTVASWEFSRGDEKRWIPIEDRPAMVGWGFRSADDHPWRAIQNPAGLMLCDAGNMYLFVCTSCPGRPADYRFDFS